MAEGLVSCFTGFSKLEMVTGETVGPGAGTGMGTGSKTGAGTGAGTGVGVAFSSSGSPTHGVAGPKISVLKSAQGPALEVPEIHLGSHLRYLVLEHWNDFD